MILDQIKITKIMICWSDLIWQWSDLSILWKLDYGNCYEQGEVRVYLDGNQIDVAYPHTPNKIVEFEFKEGSKLKITEGEDGDNCMMKFSSFSIINCIHC